MTREECKKLIMICEATYPNFKFDNPQEMLNAWSMMLEEFDGNEILLALKTFIHTSGSAFAPSISQLIAMTRKPKELAVVQEVDVWREVRPAIRNGLYHFQEEYDKLSDTAKRMVGDPAQLREWAMLPSEEIDTVIQSNFKSRFNVMQKRQLEINAMPEEVRKLIAGTNVKQIGVSE